MNRIPLILVLIALTLSFTRVDNRMKVPNRVSLSAETGKIRSLLNQSEFSQASRLLRKALLANPGNQELLNLKKDLVIKDFKKNYLKDTLSMYSNGIYEKKPNSSCNAGKLSDNAQRAFINRLNYFRRLAGVYDSCKLNPVLNDRAQKAAYMMHKNDALNHFPPKTWKCYSIEGSTAASKSNLSLGYGYLDALRGQMDDEGSGNYACGHRRWILNPYNQLFGHGSTSQSMCLYVIDTDSEGKYLMGFEDSQYVAWPAADYFPVDLIPGRWSFSLSGADFKGSSVSVQVNGKKLSISKEKLFEGYALNTLVWRMDEPAQADSVYEVRISNVRVYDKAKGRIVSRSYLYKVMPIRIS